MEMLNNIWIAVSTENLELMRIIGIPLTFIEIFLSMLLFTSILNIDTKNIKKVLYVILASMSSTITTNFIPSPYNVFLNYLLLFVIIKLLFNTNFINSIIAVFIPTVVFTLIVSLVSNPFIKIFNIGYDTIETIPIYKVLFLLITYIIATLVIFVIKLKNTKMPLLNLGSKSKKLFILTFIFGIIIICTQAFLISYYLDTLPILYSCISFFSLLLYFTLSIYCLNKTAQLELTDRELKNAEEYNNNLQILHDSVRCFKHDFDNFITTIGGYININDIEGLKSYYSQLATDSTDVNNLYLLNPKIVGNPGVYGLLTSKYKKANDLGVKMTIEFLLDMKDLKMSIYEFTRVLGILLDNAIEAAKDSDEKIVNIYFRNEFKNNRQVVIVENSYSNKDVDTVEIFEKNKTSKENHTGLGLFEIKRILNKNKNLNLFTTKNNKFFKQSLEIYSI